MRGACMYAVGAAALWASCASAFVISPVPQLQSAHGTMGRALVHAPARLESARVRGTRQGAAVATMNLGAAESWHTHAHTHTHTRRHEQAAAVSARRNQPPLAFLSNILKSWILGVLFVVSACLASPMGAYASGEVVSQGKSHIRGAANKPRTTAGKKLVIVGAGISATLQQVFDKLDTHKTGSISKATLHTALVELKKRGFMSVQLSDAELDKWLDNLVEVKKDKLAAAAAAGDVEAQAAAARLARQGPQIRFDTFVRAVEFAEKHKNNKWDKRSRTAIRDTETTKYGEKWKPKKERSKLYSKFLAIAQGSYITLIFMVLPTYYIFPWELFRFAGGDYSERSAKKSMLKRARVVGKRSEFFA